MRKLHPFHILTFDLSIRLPVRDTTFVKIGLNKTAPLGTMKDLNHFLNLQIYCIFLNIHESILVNAHKGSRREDGWIRPRGKVLARYSCLCC